MSHEEREVEYDDRPTPAELAPSPLDAKRVGEDPWLPWTCPRCGTDHPTGMPKKCSDCGWRNFG